MKVMSIKDYKRQSQNQLHKLDWEHRETMFNYRKQNSFARFGMFNQQTSNIEPRYPSSVMLDTNSLRS